MYPRYVGQKSVEARTLEVVSRATVKLVIALDILELSLLFENKNEN